jgi:hypothetical protein
MKRTAVLTLALTTLLPVAARAADVPSPDAFLGRQVGSDRYLTPWPDVVRYYQALAAASDRVSLESAGASTLGNDMLVAVITSAENQHHLDRYRDIARQLANADQLSDVEVAKLVDEGKPIALVTCSIHSTEVGSTQMSMLLAHDLATSEDPAVKRWLDDAILLLMPSINPDGQVMVVDWYDKWLGTEYEGGAMPWLYHHYVGHDDNRDFYMLTQKETRAVNDLLYKRWFPQVFLDEHQMGSTGPRMFVPPQTDPLDANVNSLVFAQADLLGTVMSLHLEEAEKTGVGSNMIYDSYWPGGTRNTAWWKNVTGLLTEVASCRIATPVYVDPNELRGASKGLPEYQRQANFISPWPGGWWRLSDIIEYERVATKAYLETIARHGREILANFARMAREAAARGRSEAPYAFLVPPDQHDPVAAALLVDLMLRHGVRAEAADKPLTLGRCTYPAGTVVIPAAQPYREFLLTMLRPQRYPEVVPYLGGPVLAPYDATTWSLPISLGIEVDEAGNPLEGGTHPIEVAPWPQPHVAAATGGWLLQHAADTVYTALNQLLAEGVEAYWLDAAHDGDVYVPAGAITPERLAEIAADAHLPVRGLDHRPSGAAFEVKPAQVGLYQPWAASMDEGWTRYLFDRYQFPYDTLHNADMKSGGYAGKSTVVLLADIPAAVIKEGGSASQYGRSPMPPEYAGGIGKEGGEKLAAWVRGGGTVVAMNRSTGYLIDLLDLPVSDSLAGVPQERFDCPGSALRLLLDTSSPLTFGMRREEVAYFDGSPAFATRVPDGRFERRVVARYPDDARDILVSGYLEGAKLLERRAAVVDVTVGKGRAILIGFKPQNRAQTHRTFKLLFNALYLPGLEKTELK